MSFLLIPKCGNKDSRNKNPSDSHQSINFQQDVTPECEGVFRIVQERQRPLASQLGHDPQYKQRSHNVPTPFYCPSFSDPGVSLDFYLVDFKTEALRSQISFFKP